MFMDNREFCIEEINETLNLVRKRIEFEQEFTDEIFVFNKTGFADKKNRISELLGRVSQCDKCSLSKTRKNVVFGDGNIDAEIVFIGEAPGRDEDLQGKPFVGTAGQLLTKIIQAMGMRREEVYITNVLRCRPPENRNPSPEEVVCCRSYLLELLKIIKPKVICALGKFAAHAVLNDYSQPISKLRGVFHDFDGIKFLATFHPAYLLRNPGDKKLVWEDMKKIMAFLGKDAKGKSD